jgi:Reverse transcriptase (RNA-dependent DNA polymerase)
LHGYRSNTVPIKNGVPQGGVLSPTLLLIYINDIKESLPRKVKCSMYADDLMKNMWAHLNSGSRLSKKNYKNGLRGMKVNANKTQYTIFTLSTKQKEIQLTFGNSSVKINNNTVYLGVTFDPRLTWAKKLTQTKGIKRMNLMKNLAGTD